MANRGPVGKVTCSFHVAGLSNALIFHMIRFNLCVIGFTKRVYLESYFIDLSDRSNLLLTFLYFS